MFHVYCISLLKPFAYFRDKSLSVNKLKMCKCICLKSSANDTALRVKDEIGRLTSYISLNVCQHPAVINNVFPENVNLVNLVYRIAV